MRWKTLSDYSTNTFKTPDKSDLPNCPFCNGEARKVGFSVHGDMSEWWIECKLCQAKAPLPIWNNRYQLTCQKVPGKMKYGTRMPKCSNCNQSLGDKRWKYCPNCGYKIVESVD